MLYIKSDKKILCGSRASSLFIYNKGYIAQDKLFINKFICLILHNRYNINMRLSSGDLLLLFLYSKGTTNQYNEPILGRTRLVKMAYIFDKEIYKDFIKDKNFEDIALPKFFEWDFGPMSKDLLQDLEFFKKINFVKAIDERNTYAFEEAQEFSALSEEYTLEDSQEQEYITQKYSLTSIGEKYVSMNLYPSLTGNQQQLLDELKKRFNIASLTKIIEYVYRKYPESTTRSKIAEKVFGKT